MLRRKGGSSGNKIETGKWLTTYADLMNNLLVMFMLLYAMSVMDLQKFEAVAEQFRKMFNTEIEEEPEDVTITIPEEYISTDPEDASIDNTPFPENDEKDTAPTDDKDTVLYNDKEENDEFNLLYEKIKGILVEKNLQDLVSVEKEDEYIYFRFTEGVLFYPDQPVLLSSSYEVLSTVGEIIYEANDYISSIDIGGHTAKVGNNSNTNYVSWELSVNRALRVLKYFIEECGLDESKMSVTGYAHFKPYANNSTKEGMALNRRVEIRLTRKTSD